MWLFQMSDVVFIKKKEKQDLMFINNIYLQIVPLEPTHFFHVGLAAISFFFFFLPVANSNVGQNVQVKKKIMTLQECLCAFTFSPMLSDM